MDTSAAKGLYSSRGLLGRGLGTKGVGPWCSGGASGASGGRSIARFPFLVCGDSA